MRKHELIEIMHGLENALQKVTDELNNVYPEPHHTTYTDYIKCKGCGFEGDGLLFIGQFREEKPFIAQRCTECGIETDFMFWLYE